jgi:nucleotide-binding universal stress UspA family protein
MLKTVLVPTDGSPLAARAIPYAAALARAANSRLIVLRALDGLQAGREPDAELAASTQLDADAGQARQQGVDVESYLHHLSREDVGEAIVETAAKREADLIVMSTHGRSGIGRFFYGSVADKVLRLATTPVMLIPANCEQAWPTDRPPRILVPLDRSELASRGLGPAIELCDQLGGELVLVHVVPFPTYAYDEGHVYATYQLEADLAAATVEIEATADSLRSGGRVVRTQVTSGVPTAAIADIAREEQADLIVMATHGRGGLARVVLGSIATATLHQAGRPVVLVRPFGPAQPAEQTPPETETTAAGRVVASGPVLTISLTPPEVDLIERGLGDLLYLPNHDPRLIQPVKALLTRLKDTSAELAGSPGSAIGATR